MSIPQKNEASLLKKAKNGDKDAFNLMVIKYQPRIMSVLYGFLKTHSAVSYTHLTLPTSG